MIGEYIIPFREWADNHVKVNFILNDGVEVLSFDKPIFKSKNETDVRNFVENQNKQLLKLYKKHFDDIQDGFYEIADNL